MKKTLLLFTLIILTFSCNNNKETNKTTIENSKQSILIGMWERKFETLPGSKHTASYTFEKDKIVYDLNGVTAKANYEINIDDFNEKLNRFIGHTDTNKYYLLMLKDVNSKSFKIHKKEIKNIEEGLKIRTIKETDEHHMGWYTYNKK